MRLLTYQSLWGMEGKMTEKLEAAKAAGHDGVETVLPSADEATLFKETLERLDLRFIAQIHTIGDHLASFGELVERAADFRPVLINAQSARDSMSESEQDAFYEGALRIEKQFGIPVGHETHRSRPLFTPWTTARLLRQFPELKITADFSHWVNVCESHLQDQEENLSFAIERTVHIHGRIGYPQGPQVPHPAADAFQGELELFTGWWRRMLLLRKERGEAFATFTAEFGPPGYMPIHHETGASVADLQEVNGWMTTYMKQLYKAWSLGEDHSKAPS